MENNETENRFNKIFWYVCFTTAFVMCYVVAVSFITIPTGSQHNVDLSLGFLLGTVLGGGIAYLVGGTPSTLKKAPTEGTTTANITADITTTPTDNKEP